MIIATKVLSKEAQQLSKCNIAKRIGTYFDDISIRVQALHTIT